MRNRRGLIAPVAVAAVVLAACEPPLAMRSTGAPGGIGPSADVAAQAAHAHRVLDALVALRGDQHVALTTRPGDAEHADALLRFSPEWWARPERSAAPQMRDVVEQSKASAASVQHR